MTPMPQETKDKISAAQKGRRRQPRSSSSRIPPGVDHVLDALREIHEDIEALKESDDFREFMSGPDGEDARQGFIEAERLFRLLRIGRAFDLMEVGGLAQAAFSMPSTEGTSP